MTLMQVVQILYRPKITEINLLESFLIDDNIISTYQLANLIGIQKLPQLHGNCQELGSRHSNFLIWQMNMHEFYR